MDRGAWWATACRVIKSWTHFMHARWVKGVIKWQIIFYRGVIVKWKNRMRHKPELKGTKQDMTPFLLSAFPFSPSFLLSFLPRTQSF